MNTKFIFGIIFSLAILFQGCNSSQDEWIEQCEEILTHKNYHWINKFFYQFDGDVFTVFEECTFYEDHTYKSILTYCYKDKAYAQVFYSGGWEIEYDSKLKAFFFYWEEYLEEVRNLAMNERMFNKLDTEIRTSFYGDAYDSLQGTKQPDELEGIELIDCTKQSFIIKYLSSGDIEKYYRIPGDYDPFGSRDDYMWKYNNLVND